MSLMNDALCNLDDLRKHNTSNDSDAQYASTRLNIHQATIDELDFVWQGQDEKIDCVDNKQRYFVFFHEYYFYKLIFMAFLLLFFGCTAYVFLYKKQPDVAPVLQDTTSRYDIMSFFYHTNDVPYRFKYIDQSMIDVSKTNINKVPDKEVPDKEVPDNEVLDDSFLVKNTKKILLLNDKGYAALANDFLSTPKNNNAISYFRQVLTIDEDNVLALQGIDSVYRRYEKLIVSNIERHDWPNAQTMLNRLLSIGGDSEAITNYKELISQNLNNKHKSEKVSNGPSLVNKDGTSYLFVEKSRHYREKEALLRSQQWVKKNKIEKGIDELNSVLNTQNYLTKSSAEFLFDLYLRIGDIDAARTVGYHVKNVTKTTLNNNFWDVAYENARIEQVKNGDLAALKILKKIKVDRLGESSARLYAGLLQKNGDYVLAQNLYRSLVNVYDENATYWLGYAVTSDALGQPGNALIGYRKTQKLGGVSSDVQSYIANRVLILQSDDYSLSHLMEPSW